MMGNKRDSLELELSNDDDHDSDEIWLISYADLMTLLFGFFVMMYSLTSMDLSNQEDIRKGMSKAFGGTYVPPHQELLKEIGQQKGIDPVLAAIDLDPTKEGLEITFRSGLLFKSGSAYLLDEAEKSLRTLVRIITENVTDAEIFIAGHTDDIPMTSKMYPTNWELSTARASTVVRAFEEVGYDRHLLIAVGYGETRPEYPNRDKDLVPIIENQKKNRRVVIKVLSSGIVRQVEGK